MFAVEMKMTKFAILFLVAQALLIQNVFSACLQGPSVNLGSVGLGSSCGCGASLNNAFLGSDGLNIAGLNAGALNSAVLNSGYGSYSGYSGSGYGGSGTGEISAAGDLDVGGYTNVYGNLPVTGLLVFEGYLPAGGCVSLVGDTPSICDCGCNRY